MSAVLKLTADQVLFFDRSAGSSQVKVSVKVNLVVSLKSFVFENLESVGSEVYLPAKKKSEKFILKPLKSLFFVSRHNLHEK